MIKHERLPGLLFIALVRYPEGRTFSLPVDELRAARHAQPAGTFKGALEYIWRQMNHVDGTEWIGSKHFEHNYGSARSMSVGDTVEIKTANASRHFRVDTEGWSEVVN